MVACNDCGRCMKNIFCNVKIRIENFKFSVIYENFLVYLRMVCKSQEIVFNWKLMFYDIDGKYVNIL